MSSKVPKGSTDRRCGQNAHRNLSWNTITILHPLHRNRHRRRPRAPARTVRPHSISQTNPKQIVQTIKSITARAIFKQNPEVKRMLWGGEFWTKGYYINTVGQYATADIIRNYVKNQGKQYTKLHQGQSTLFGSLE